MIKRDIFKSFVQKHIFEGLIFLECSNFVLFYIQLQPIQLIFKETQVFSHNRENLKTRSSFKKHDI